VETGNTDAVLDGEIDDFLDAEVRWLRLHSADGQDGSGRGPGGAPG
jgi:peptide chain release factor 2